MGSNPARQEKKKALDSILAWGEDLGAVKDGMTVDLNRGTVIQIVTKRRFDRLHTNNQVELLKIHFFRIWTAVEALTYKDGNPGADKDRFRTQTD